MGPHSSWSIHAKQAPFNLDLPDNTGVNPVPEPGTMLILGFGMAGVFALRRKYKAA